MVDVVAKKQAGRQAITELRGIVTADIDSTAKRTRAMNALAVLDGIINSL